MIRLQITPPIFGCFCGATNISRRAIQQCNNFTHVWAIYSDRCKTTLSNIFSSTIYGKTFKRENFRGYGTKFPLVGKLSQLHACRLTLPIDKAIIHGKTFAIE